MACEKDPDLSKLDNEYLVFTNYDKQADFASFTTYYLPDSVMWSVIKKNLNTGPEIMRKKL